MHARHKSSIPKFRNVSLIRPNRRSLNHCNTLTAHSGQQYQVKHHALALKVRSKNKKRFRRSAARRTGVQPGVGVGSYRVHRWLGSSNHQSGRRFTVKQGATTSTSAPLDSGLGGRRPSSLLGCVEKWQSDHTCHHRHWFNGLDIKRERWNGNRSWQWVWQLRCPRHAGVEWNDRGGKLTDEAITRARSQMLRSLRLTASKAQSRGYHTISWKKRGLKKSQRPAISCEKGERGPLSVTATLKMLRRRHCRQF